MKTITDHEAKEQLIKIGEILGIAPSDINPNTAYYPLGDNRELFLRLYGAGGRKGYASVSPKAFFRRGSDSPYFNLKHSTISINFAEGKAPEKIAQDVKRRLLNAPNYNEVSAYVRGQIESFKNGKEKQSQLAESLEKAGVERIGEGKAYYNSNGLYMDMRIEGGNFYFDRFSIDRTKAIEVVEALIKIHAKN